MTNALEIFVAPLTMLWFAFYWSHVSSVDLSPELRIKAGKIANAGVTAGFLAALVLLFLFFSLWPSTATCAAPSYAVSLSSIDLSLAYFKQLVTVSWRDIVSALVGLVVGAITSYAESFREKILKSDGTIWKPQRWFVLVAGSTGLGIASLAIYYIGGPYCGPHRWLMWAYLALLVGFRLVAAVRSLEELK